MWPRFNIRRFSVNDLIFKLSFIFVLVNKHNMNKYANILHGRLNIKILNFYYGCTNQKNIAYLLCKRRRCPCPAPPPFAYDAQRVFFYKLTDTSQIRCDVSTFPQKSRV